MYNNGNNAMKQDNDQGTYNTYEENFGSQNGNMTGYQNGRQNSYSSGRMSSADSLEQELFYGGNTQNQRQNIQQNSYYQQPGMSRSMYAEPQSQEQANEFEGYSEDEMPSLTTMQFKENRYEANSYNDEDSASERRFKISTKGKVIAAVYAIVIATILALIVLNTRLLKNMDNQIAAQQAEIAQLLEQKVDLNDTYNFVKSDAVIEQKAQEFGMIHD